MTVKMTKYLEFRPLPIYGKTDIYSVDARSSGSSLGRIQWYGPWRQYCFFPALDCVFNNMCLKDIAEFCSEVTAQHRAKASD